jgi:hypothetical protein
MSWRAPSAAEEGGDGEALVGRHVRVQGLGEGTVTAFSKSAFGASAHTIQPADGGGEKKVKLARKGNGKAPWEVWAGGQLPPRPASTSPIIAGDDGTTVMRRAAQVGRSRGYWTPLAPPFGRAEAVLTPLPPFGALV